MKSQSPSSATPLFLVARAHFDLSSGALQLHVSLVTVVFQQGTVLVID